MTKATKRLTEKQTDESVRLSEDTHSAVFAMFFSILAGLAVVSGLGYAFIRSTVVKPISALAGTMNILANGNLNASVDGAERRDEIGAMAKAVQVFKDNGLKARDLEAQAVQARSMTEAERARAAEVDSRRAGEMAEATNGLAEG